VALSPSAVTSTQASAVTGVATSATSFSPAAGALVAVMFTWIYSTNATGVTFTVQDSSGTSYTVPSGQVVDAGGYGGLYNGIAYHTYSAAPGSITVKVTASNTGTAACLITPLVFTGQASSPVGPNVLNGSSGSAATTAEGSITTTQTGSYVVAAGNGNGNATLTPTGNLTSLGAWNNATLGGTAGAAVTTSATVTPGATTVGWTFSASITYGYGIVAVEILPGSTTVTGAASWTGSGTFGATGVFAGSSGWTGSGAFAPAWSFAESAGWSGSGAFTPVASVSGGEGSAGLTGSGTFGALGGAVYEESAGWSGTGTLATTEFFAQWSGTGTLGISGIRLGLGIGLTGTGTFSIPQVAGGLVAGVGGAATPQALPGSSQVAVAPPGSSAWQWLGTIGQVTALTYSYVCPGGCDQMTATVMVPASYRTQLFNPGWQVKITRGGHQVWDGKLDEPVPTASGWNLTAVGTGNLGANFVAFYAPGDVWPASEPDEVVNRAIARGLPWVNPGLNSSPYFSQFWFGQEVDPGAQTVTAMLNLLCTRGGLTWYVNSQPGGILGDDLNVFPLPTVPNRLLVSTTPVARTLGGDVNTIFVRFLVTADNSTTGAVAAYNVVEVQNLASVAAHGTLEQYFDLSDAGVLTLTQAQAVAENVLSVYVRASFAGPFQASYGQLLTTGGQAVDPGTDQAGTMVRMILSDYAQGGEVTPAPITWIVGAYSWDDFQQVATITPYQDLDQSLSGLLSMTGTVMTPITAAST
jgi:hypothetical protein